jgi:hypothetical protein
MRVSDDNEVRLMLHRSLTGVPIVLEVRLDKLVDEMLILAEAVKVWETAPRQICFMLEDAA